MNARHRMIRRASATAALVAALVAGGMALPCRGAERAANWSADRSDGASPVASSAVQVLPPPPKSRRDATGQVDTGGAPAAVQRWADDAEAGVRTALVRPSVAWVEPEASDEPSREPLMKRMSGAERSAAEPALPIADATPIAEAVPVEQPAPAQAAVAADQATPWATPTSFAGAADSVGMEASKPEPSDAVEQPAPAAPAQEVSHAAEALATEAEPDGSVVRVQAAAEPALPPPPQPEAQPQLMPLPKDSPFQPETYDPGAATPMPDPTTSQPPAGPTEPQRFGETQQQQQQQQQQQAEPSTRLQFLRQQSVLLKPGEYQWDITFQYLIDETDFAAAQVVGNQLFIGQARRRQRLMLVPIEFRLGLCEDTQVFVNVPFGWSNNEFNFHGQSDFSDFGGIGDVSAGVTRVLMEEDDCCPTVLATVGFAAPTGQANLTDALSTPGSTLGEGFWSLTTGLTFIRTYDPVVLFYGFGYRHRFQNDFDGGITVNPGKQIFYRLGVGFAVNPRVTFSSAFTGSYITDDFVNGTRISGSTEEPLQLRLALTVAKARKGSRNSVETVEPFVTFGLTDEAPNAVLGLSWTR